MAELYTDRTAAVAFGVIEVSSGSWVVKDIPSRKMSVSAGSRMKSFESI
jgi:hypothetical protein